MPPNPSNTRVRRRSLCSQQGVWVARYWGRRPVSAGQLPKGMAQGDEVLPSLCTYLWTSSQTISQARAGNRRVSVQASGSGYR